MGLHFKHSHTPATVAPCPPATPVQAPATKKPRNGSVRALPVTGLDLNQPGRLKKGHVMTYLGLSSTALYERIKAGTAPEPDGYDGMDGPVGKGGIGGRKARPYWLTSTIRDFLAGAK